MTKEQESFLGMLLKVKNLRVQTVDQMSSLPVLDEYYSEFNSHIEQLLHYDIQASQDLTGYTLEKAEVRAELEQVAQKVSNAIAAYGVVQGDDILRKKAQTNSSDWYRMSEESLVTQAGIVNSLSTSLTADLLSYGASAEDRTSLTATLTAFINIISDPTLAIDNRKSGNAMVAEKISELRSFMSDRLDVLMRTFQATNPELHSRYKSARAIDINAGISQPQATVVAAANSTTVVYTLSVYNPDALFTIRNKGAVAVQFSLSETADAQGNEKVTLEAGETRSRLASNLGGSGTYLVVHNATSEPTEISVWVE